MHNKSSLSVPAVKRLSLYLAHLMSLPEETTPNISATKIANALGLNAVQVRKDLAAVSDGGRPKVGYITKELIADIQACIGSGKGYNAVLVGAGNLGKALLNYNDFSSYGLDIVAAFDRDESNIGTEVNGKRILSVEALKKECQSKNVSIGIIAVPAPAAQAVCDLLIDTGVSGIWNFAHVKLIVPKEVAVLEEHIGTSLPWLVSHMTK